MSLVLRVIVPPATARRALLEAVGLEDDGGAAFELGRPETGATCLLLNDPDDPRIWEVHLPLMRSPTSAADLLPALAAGLAGVGGGLAIEGERILDRGELLEVWGAAHVDACRALARICVEQGAPPPPHLPREALERLHGWLVAVAPLGDVAQPILGLDPGDGSRARLAVGLPDGPGVIRLPPVDDVLVNIDDVTRVVPREAFGPPRDDGFVVVDLDGLGEPDRKLFASHPPLAARVISCVEIVDEESLTEPGQAARS